MNYRIITIAILGSIGSFITNGQQRYVDLEAEHLSPAGEVMNGAALPLDFYIKNNGPDEIITGDTIYYQLTYENSGSYEYTYVGVLRGGGIPVGAVSQYAENYGIRFDFGDIEAPITIDFCLLLFSKAVDLETGDTITLNHSDTNFSNNKDCKPVTVLPKAGTGVGNTSSLAPEFNLYPNPASNHCYILFGEINIEKARLYLVDIYGRMVLNQDLWTKDIDNRNYLLDVSTLDAGIYILTVEAEGNRYSKKVIVKKYGSGTRPLQIRD